MGIKFSRSKTFVNSFKVPIKREDGSIFENEVVVLPDSSHLLKNTRNALMSYNFVFDDEFVKKHNLPSNTVDLNHIKELNEFQRGKSWLYAPKLNDGCFPRGSYEKMRVSPAANLLSRDVASGLRMLVKSHDYPKEMLTTAKFCELTGEYWDAVSSRSTKQCALSLANVEKHEEKIAKLQEYSEMMSGLSFQCKTGGQEKPIQAGTNLLVKGLIDLDRFFLTEQGLPFLLLGRFSSDAIENYFSMVRARNRAPTAVEHLRAFKALLVLKQLKPNKKGNCTLDDESHTGNWLTDLNDVKQLLEMDKLDDEDHEPFPILIGDKLVKDFDQENSMANALGYMLKKTILKQSLCEDCQEFFISKDTNLDCHTFIEERAWREGSLTLPSLEAYKLFSFLESSFGLNSERIKLEEITAEAFVNKFFTTVLNMFPGKIPLCHFYTLIKRFISMRLHFWSEQQTKIEKSAKKYKESEANSAFASRSMGGHFMSTYKDTRK